MVTLLLAARQDGMALLEQACQQVLQLGGSSATLVLNQLQRLQRLQRLHRLQRPIKAPAVQARVVPLTRPPEASCQRYDHLLAGGPHVSR